MVVVIVELCKGVWATVMIKGEGWVDRAALEMVWLAAWLAGWRFSEVFQGDGGVNAYLVFFVELLCLISRWVS